MTNKPDSRREAIAESVLSFPAPLTEMLRTGTTEKGDALGVARTAGIMAAKRAWELVPLCHPMSLTYADLEFELRPGRLSIRATVRTLGPTGVEMEALAAVTVAALTVYDMLKPHSTELEIGSTRLISKRGGKRGDRVHLDPPARAAIIVVSDSVARGTRKDTAGPAVVSRLRDCGVHTEPLAIVPDEPRVLRERVKQAIDSGMDFVLTVGGTGVGQRDLTVEALAGLIERELLGVMEAARAYGQRRVRRAMLSRGIAGVAGNSILVTLPGSKQGAIESVDALFPPLLHAVEVLRGTQDEHGHD